MIVWSVHKGSWSSQAEAPIDKIIMEKPQSAESEAPSLSTVAVIHFVSPVRARIDLSVSVAGVAVAVSL